MTVISYPIPLYQNVAINTSYYKPRFSVIDDLTLGNVTRVTTTTNYNFKLGQQVRFIIPPGYGTRELNGQQGVIVSLESATEFTVALNSVGMTPFTSSSNPNQPMILPIGDVNTGAINASGNSNNELYIKGSFINVSPNG